MLKKNLRYSKALQHFEIRGAEGSRLQSLSDGVFALAIAMLLISGSMPENFKELSAFVSDAIPFAICMLFLYWIWLSQARYFLRFGIEDDRTVFLNFALLFFVLFYVYPLKFLMTWLVRYFHYLFATLLVDRSYSTELQALGNIIPFHHLSWLMVIYGFGFVSIFLLLYLLYRHALAHREALRLTAIEILETRFIANSFLLVVGIGILSLVISLIGTFFKSGMFPFFGGLVYNLIWVFSIFRTKSHTKQLNQLLDQTSE